MKIRSYKGTSRETICETILREMGPEAIIVSSRESTELKGFMPKRYYELLAVADDASSDAHLLERATGSEEVRELAKRQEERWKAFDRRFDRLQLELRDAGPLAGGGGGGGADPGSEDVAIDHHR
jgi:flagellar biosynthesis GTPase FlhF